MSIYKDFDGDFYTVDVDYNKAYFFKGDDAPIFFKSHEEFVDYICDRLGEDMRTIFQGQAFDYFEDYRVDIQEELDIIEGIKDVVLELKTYRKLLPKLQKLLEKLEILEDL